MYAELTRDYIYIRNNAIVVVSFTNGGRRETSIPLRKYKSFVPKIVTFDIGNTQRHYFPLRCIRRNHCDVYLYIHTFYRDVRINFVHNNTANSRQSFVSVISLFELFIDYFHIFHHYTVHFHEINGFTSVLYNAFR